VQAGGHAAEISEWACCCAVTEVRQRQPGELSLTFPDGLQVGQHLAGWNSSVSALTTGTVDTEAIASIRFCANVRQTTACTYRDRTRDVSSIVSSRRAASSGRPR